VDKKLALCYYSRWKFISDFLPALKRAKEAGEDAKVLSVLAAAKGSVIDTDDIGLGTTFSFIKARKQIPTYNDLMMEVSKPSFPFHYFRYPTTLISILRNTPPEIQISPSSTLTQDLSKHP
jgi:hypothetical protein